MRTESEIDVLVLGGAGVDTIVYVPELPLPFADSHLVPAIETRAGQTGDFMAVAVHTLGLRTHHLDLLGDDLPQFSAALEPGGPPWATWSALCTATGVCRSPRRPCPAAPGAR